MSDEQIHNDIRELRQDIKDMREEFNHYKGFIGGVMFAVSAVSAFIGFCISFVKGH